MGQPLNTIADTCVVPQSSYIGITDLALYWNKSQLQYVFSGRLTIRIWSVKNVDTAWISMRYLPKTSSKMRWQATL